jgi:hypothetical protein
MEYFGHFYAHMRERGRHAITPEFASEVVRRFFDVKGPYGDVMRHANVPPAFAVVQRVNLGLFAVLAQLGAAADWRSIGEELWPWVDGPPAGELGALDARRADARRPGPNRLIGGGISPPTPSGQPGAGTRAPVGSIAHGFRSVAGAPGAPGHRPPDRPGQGGAPGP